MAVRPKLLATSDVKTIVDKLIYNLSHHTPSKRFPPAACFDVDECLLFNDADGSAKVTAHPHMKRLYDAVARLGYTIFIITARAKTENGFTYLIQQLRGIGYDLRNVPLDGVYLQPASFYDRGATGEYKESARRHIREKFQVDVVLMCGDQATDLFRDGDLTFDALMIENNLDPERGRRLAHLIAHPDEVTTLGLRLPDLTP